MTDFAVRIDGRGVGVVTPQGRLTMVSARSLRTAVEELVAGGAPKVVVDLSETTFLDSSGLGALIAGLKTCRQAGGDLRIAAPTDAVLAVLQLTNLDKVLRPRESAETAFDV